MFMELLSDHCLIVSLLTLSTQQSETIVHTDMHALLVNVYCITMGFLLVIVDFVECWLQWYHNSVNGQMTNVYMYSWSLWFHNRFLIGYFVSV